MDQALIVDYLLDQLDEPARREVEARLGEDPSLARECADLAEVLAGVSVTGSAPAANDGGLRERVLDTLDPARRFDGFARRIGRLFDLDEAAAAAVLARSAAGPGPDWVPYGPPGAFVLPVSCGPALGGADGAIVHLARGVDLPRHRHRGREQMLVLDGFAREDGGRVVAPGDVVASEPGTEHDFEILQDAPCVFACTIEGGVDWLADRSPSASR